MIPRPAIAGALAAAVAWVLWCPAPAAGASTVPLAGRQLFTQRSAVSPLVAAVGMDMFGGADGTDLDGRTAAVGGAWQVLGGAFVLAGDATVRVGSSTSVAVLGTGRTAVLVGADLLFPTSGRQAGVVLHQGPQGSLRVVVENDSPSTQIVALDVVDADGAVTRVAATAPGPTTASTQLRVESGGGSIGVWADGQRVLSHSLSGVPPGLLAQTRHGIVVGHDGDTVDGFLVLARN